MYCSPSVLSRIAFLLYGVSHFTYPACCSSTLYPLAVRVLLKVAQSELTDAAFSKSSFTFCFQLFPCRFALISPMPLALLSNSIPLSGIGSMPYCLPISSETFLMRSYSATERWYFYPYSESSGYALNTMWLCRQLLPSTWVLTTA